MEKPVADESLNLIDIRLEFEQEAKDLKLRWTIVLVAWWLCLWFLCRGLIFILFMR